MGKIHREKSKAPIKGTGRLINWLALKADFIQSNETLFQFLQRHGIKNEQWFYRMARKYGFREAQEASRIKAVEKVSDSTARKYAVEWERQMKLWRAVESVAARILNEMAEKRPQRMDASKLANLTAALERALKSQRLVLGESTENVNSRNYHMAIVQALKDVESGQPFKDDYNTPAV